MNRFQSSRNMENNNTLVCIDTYDYGVMKGSFFNVGIGRWEVFDSAIDFLVKMEAVLKETNIPQAFTEMRAFSPSLSVESIVNETERKKSGKLATFNIKILFRQNASWQGLCGWLEGKQEQSFRSVLELFFLLHSALIAE